MGLLKVFFFFLICSIATALPNKSNPGDTLKRHEVLQENVYEVDWTVDFPSEEIEFIVTVRTTGFIGFGISYTGSMENSDMIIGGVFSNGSSYFNDRYAVGKMLPEIDTSQDWHLIEANENGTHTILKFKRKLDTCDEKDIAITDDTLKIIWCYGNTDEIKQHVHRGLLAVNFKDPASEAKDLSSFKQWHTVQPLELPANDTTYWCTFYKGPNLNKKHHVVGFDIFLNGSASKNHTHHADLYKCTPPPGQTADEFFSKYLGNGYDCYFSAEYFPVEHCALFEFQWSIGGKVTMFPDNVGVPVGEDSNEYYMTEIHYDNPKKLSGLQVHSGMEMYYTDKLRDIEAGFLQVGVMSSKTYSLTIPPNSRDFVVSSHCPSECTSNLPKDGVNAFVYLLHSHLSGRKQKIRHYRKDKELPWMANDEHYDFNYQNNRHFRKEIQILPGDQLTLECTYDTTWKQGKATLGGRSARDEMCQTFIMYYPRTLEINQCGSYFSRKKMLNYLGIDKVTNVTGVIDQTIVLPERLKGIKYSQYVESMNWTPEKRAEFQKMIRYDPQDAYCVPFTTNDNFMAIQYPKISEEYQMENNCRTAANLSTPYLVILGSLCGIIALIIVLLVIYFHVRKVLSGRKSKITKEYVSS